MDALTEKIKRKWEAFCDPFMACMGGHGYYIDRDERTNGRRTLRDVSDLHGIIHNLTETHGGNVHDLGIVNITSKSDGFT
jgi:hypothetical protein